MDSSKYREPRMNIGGNYVADLTFPYNDTIMVTIANRHERIIMYGKN